VISSNKSNKESAEAEASCALMLKVAVSALTISKNFFILFVKWLIPIKLASINNPLTLVNREMLRFYQLVLNKKALKFSAFLKQ
jgi:hypothetical protein